MPINASSVQLFTCFITTMVFCLIVFLPKAIAADGNSEENGAGWSDINAEVDLAIPIFLKHLQASEIEFLKLPDLKENVAGHLIPLEKLSVTLTNGKAYNLAGIERYGNATLSYGNKQFLANITLIFKELSFDYDAELQLPLLFKGYGEVTGRLETVAVKIQLGFTLSKIQVNDFRIVDLGRIQVALNGSPVVRQLTEVFISPLASLFKNHIVSTFSESLKEQIQMLFDDFTKGDPLQLHDFSDQLLGGLVKKT